MPRAPKLALYGAYAPDLVYSAGEVADLVDYARLRGVRVVPEIDVPRHAANGWQFGEVEGEFISQVDLWQVLQARKGHKIAGDEKNVV